MLKIGAYRSFTGQVLDADSAKLPGESRAYVKGCTSIQYLYSLSALSMFFNVPLAIATLRFTR